MKFTLLVVIIGILALAACSTENKPVDPTAIKDTPFSGITFTDLHGSINGPVDTDDWRLYVGDIFADSPSGNGAHNSSSILSTTRVSEVFPNPFNGHIILFDYTVLENTKLTIRIISQELIQIYSNEWLLEPGNHIIPWSPEIDWVPPFEETINPPDGTYRVCYTMNSPNIGIRSGYGDIWLTHGESWWLGE